MPLQVFSRRKRPKLPPKRWELLGILRRIRYAVARLFVSAAVALAGIVSLIGKPVHEADVVGVPETVTLNTRPAAHDGPVMKRQGVSISGELASERDFPHTHEDIYVHQIVPQGGIMATGTASAVNDLSVDWYDDTSLFS